MSFVADLRPRHRIVTSALQYTLLCQFSPKKRSPFEAEAEKNGIKFPGGKVDDISIVVAMVVEDGEETLQDAKKVG